MRKELAKVKDVFFWLEDHGMLAFGLEFNFGGSGQGTGLYNVRSQQGANLIWEILKMFGAERLGQLVGRTCFVVYDDDSRIVGIEMPPFDGGKRLLFKDILVA